MRDQQYSELLIRKGADPVATLVLVKFTFNNPKWIPTEIPQKDRDRDEDMDAFHAQIAATEFQRPDLGEIGRYRPGRVDTGVPVVKNAQLCHVGMARTGLRRNGFVLTDLHWFEREPGEEEASAKFKKFPTKAVVTAAFQPVSPEVLANLQNMPQRAITGLRKLAGMTWNYCHVWDNPNGVVTVNFVGRMPDQKPRRSIIISGGAIGVDLVQEVLSEDQETESSINAAFEIWSGNEFNPHIADTNHVAAKIDDAFDRADQVA